MAEYENITQTEMEEFLFPLGFRKMILSGVRELVYGKRVDTDGLILTLRVYTGIEPSGSSRSAGSDAIRCNIFWRKSDEEVRKVATSKRVHRVKGWRDNLAQRLATLTIEKRCMACGAPMVIRKSKNGEFYGCASFPECRNTERKEGNG